MKEVTESLAEDDIPDVPPVAQTTESGPVEQLAELLLVEDITEDLVVNVAFIARALLGPTGPRPID